MGKRKNRGGQVHPTNSFQQLVADATLGKLGGYIDSQIQQAAQAIMIRNQQAMNNLMVRIVAHEDILEASNLATKDQLAEKVAAVQDRFEGFEVVEGPAEAGDRVRFEIKTRTADQTEFQGSSRMMLDNLASGQTLGKELEGALVGMKSGETKEVKFGKDESLVAQLTVNKISRAPKQEAPAEEDEAAPAAAPAEAPSADANAG